MGEKLFEKNIVPDKIYTSTANRAINTAKIIANKINFSGELVEKEAFYHASENDLFKEINKFDNSSDVVFMFGHNPGLTYLAEKLTTETFGNIPTTGIVGIQFPFDNWATVSAGTGDVILYDYPKNYIQLLGFKL